jgi:hypothetical protein
MMVPALGQLVILRATAPNVSPVPMQWARPKGPNETLWYWLDLTEWSPPSNIVTFGSVARVAIAGDTNDLTITGAVADSGLLVIPLAPGILYNSQGPRLRAQFAGGSSGNTYSVVWAWTDDQGRTVSRTALLSVE